MSAKLSHLIFRSFVAAALALPVSAAGATEKLSSSAIVDALTLKKPLTRSLSMAAAEQTRDAETKAFIDTLRNRRARSLSLNEREHIASIAQEKPRVDLEIRFEFNSAQISPSALADMDALGKALTSPALKGSSFVLSGHTDAIGGEDFNQDLSERRADAVKQYLVEKYGLLADALVTAGYGKTQLRDEEHPRAAENRRVEVVNMVER